MKARVAGLEGHIDRIYDAAVAPERWPVFLDGLKRELRLATLGLIFRHPSDNDHGIIASATGDEDYGRSYRSHYYKLNPWLPWGAVAEEGRVLLADSVLPQSELVRTEFYNDWMRPRGLAQLFTAFLHNSGRGEPLSEIGGLRAKRDGPLEDEDLEPVRMLVPHLQRALAIHARVEGAEMRAGAAAEALDRILGGLILLDERGSPILTNRIADQILAANDGLALDREGTSAATRKQTAELRRLISEAASTGAGKGVKAGGVMRLARPSGRPALEVVVAPVRRGSSPMFACAVAAAAIFVADPDARSERPPERLRRVYGLTPKEAEVASCLVDGMSPSEIRDALGITIHTVRGHLKQLFAKTDTHRQAELIRELLSGLASIRLE